MNRLKSDRKILITGIDGFLGKSFHLYFIDQGINVSGLSIDAEYTKNNPVYFTDYSQTHLISILSSFQPDIIIHTAGPSSVANSISNPDDDFRGSVIITQNLLEAVRRCNIKPLIVYPSSASVYGNPVSLPVPEESALSPISPYGHHKLICEQLLKEYNSICNIPILIIRLFSVFGILQKKLLIWELFEQFQNKPEVVLKGTGFETRDYIFIDDLVRVVSQLIETTTDRALVYNLASGSAVSITQIVNQMAQFFSAKPIFYHNNEVQGNPSHWQADISLLKSVVAYETIPFEIALRDVIHKWTEKKSG